MCCIDCHCIYYRLTVEPPLHSCEKWRVNFTLLTANFTAVMEGSTTSTLNKDPKDQESQESLIGANWPSLPLPANSQNSQEKQEDQESQIQPGQKPPKDCPMEEPAQRTCGLRERQGGQICPIFQREWNIAHPWDRRTARTQDPLAGCLGYKNKKAGRLEERNLWGSLEEGRHPLSIFL